MEGKVTRVSSGIPLKVMLDILVYRYGVPLKNSPEYRYTEKYSPENSVYRGKSLYRLYRLKIFSYHIGNPKGNLEINAIKSCH